MATHHKHELAIFVAAILIGLIGVLVKLIGDAIPAMSLNFIRMFFAFLVTLAIVPFFDKKTFKVDKDDIKDFALVGLLMAATFSFYVLGMLYAPVSNVVLISSLYIFFTAVIGFFILKEKLTKKHFIYIPLALIGLYFIHPFAGNTLGNIFAFIQSILFAILIIALRMSRKEHGVGAVMWYFLFASLFLSPFVFIYGLGKLFSVMHLVLLLSVLSTSLVYLLLTYGLQKARANTAAIISFITIPLASIGFAYFIINEALPTNIVISAIILLTAGIIALWKDSFKTFFGH